MKSPIKTPFFERESEIAPAGKGEERKSLIPHGSISNPLNLKRPRKEHIELHLRFFWREEKVKGKK